MSSIRRKGRDPKLLIADAVGIAHFIVVFAVAIYGERTNYFLKLDPTLSDRHSGFDFVYHYIDLPAYLIFRGVMGQYGANLDSGDILVSYIGALIVIASSSGLYGAFVYWILAFIDKKSKLD